MEQPNNDPNGSPAEIPKPRRPVDTLWGTGPWPVQPPTPIRSS